MQICDFLTVISFLLIYLDFVVSSTVLPFSCTALARDASRLVHTLFFTRAPRPWEDKQDNLQAADMTMGR